MNAPFDLPGFFDLPAELARLDREYVPVVIEYHFGPLTITEARIELRPTCPDCRALWESWGTEQPCDACNAEDARAFAAGEKA